MVSTARTAIHLRSYSAAVHAECVRPSPFDLQSVLTAGAVKHTQVRDVHAADRATPYALAGHSRWPSPRTTACSAHLWRSATRPNSDGVRCRQRREEGSHHRHPMCACDLYVERQLTGRTDAAVRRQFKTGDNAVRPDGASRWSTAHIGCTARNADHRLPHPSTPSHPSSRSGGRSRLHRHPNEHAF